MRMSAAFPSKFLKCADLEGNAVTLTIESVKMEVMDERSGDTKPVVYFNEKDRGLALNVTNANMISEMYGDESDGWTGKQIEIFPAKTDFQGRVVDCLRVGKPNGGAAGKAPF